MLAHLQACHDEVVGLDREVDITDPAALSAAVTAAAPDAVCHLAAQSSVGASWEDRWTTYSVNIIGAIHVVEAALACADRPRVLLVSSSEVYGTVRPSDLPLREDRPFAPVSPYAASKAAAELIGLQAWLGRGLEVVLARPFNHTGPGQRPDFVVPALARQVAEAARQGLGGLLAGNLAVRRDITDVRDVVRAYRLLLEHGAPGQAYNVCRGQSVSIAEVAQTLLDLAGLEVPIGVDPARVRSVDLPDLRGDVGKLTRATGWLPEIPLERTLADVLAHWTEVPATPAQ